MWPNRVAERVSRPRRSATTAEKVRPRLQPWFLGFRVFSGCGGFPSVPPSSCTDQHALPFGSAVPQGAGDTTLISRRLRCGRLFFLLDLQPQYGIILQRAALQKTVAVCSTLPPWLVERLLRGANNQEAGYSVPFIPSLPFCHSRHNILVQAFCLAALRPNTPKRERRRRRSFWKITHNGWSWNSGASATLPVPRVPGFDLCYKSVHLGLTCVNEKASGMLRRWMQPNVSDFCDLRF